jgi:hypothetical protein
MDRAWFYYLACKPIAHALAPYRAAGTKSSSEATLLSLPPPDRATRRLNGRREDNGTGLAGEWRCVSARLPNAIPMYSLKAF